MKKLLIPNGHLSWSGIFLWKRSPEKYIEKYIYGGEPDKSEYMDFGSKVAKSLETKEDTDDEMVNMLCTLLPKYSKSEEEIKATLNGKEGSVLLLGKPDSLDPVNLEFIEYKTGTRPWTQNLANEHGQLDHYASILWLKHKKISPRIRLCWAETEKSEGIKLTGRVRTFEVKKTLGDILEYLSQTYQIAKEIDKVYREELKKNIA
jgi:hypothetical protein